MKNTAEQSDTFDAFIWTISTFEHCLTNQIRELELIVV